MPVEIVAVYLAVAVWVAIFALWDGGRRSLIRLFCCMLGAAVTILLALAAMKL